MIFQPTRLLLRRNAVDTLPHFTYQTLHTVSDTVCLHTNADGALPTRPIHSGATTTPEADIDATEV